MLSLRTVERKLADTASPNLRVKIGSVTFARVPGQAGSAPPESPPSLLGAMRWPVRPPALRIAGAMRISNLVEPGPRVSSNVSRHCPRKAVQ